jgi:hypothetical protein
LQPGDPDEASVNLYRALPNRSSLDSGNNLTGLAVDALNGAVAGLPMGIISPTGRGGIAMRIIVDYEASFLTG